MIDDQIVREPWPEPLREALQKLSQGDVLEGIPFGYYAEARSCVTVGAQQLTGEGGEVQFVELDAGSSPPFAIVTTQTCDVGEEDAPQPRRPWIHLAPVYRRDDFGDRSRFFIDVMKVRYLVALTGPHFSDGYWVADLRIQIPFDKGIVLGRPVHKGFATVDECEEFARRLGRQYDRPVFEKLVSDQVVESMRKFFNRRDIMRDKFRAAGVRELRLKATATAPFHAQVLVVLESGADATLAREVMNAWYSLSATVARDAGVELLEVRYGDMQMLSAAEYMSAHPINLEWLIPRVA